MGKRYEIRFGVTVTEDLAEVVRAAQWIDDNLKTLLVMPDWRDKIDVDLLDLADPFCCVLGQVTAYERVHPRILEAEDQGHIAAFVFADEEIEYTWREYFHAHRLATNA